MWELPLRAGTIVRSPIAVDAAGDLYWSEEYAGPQGSPTQQIVSVAATGAPRWRHDVRAREPDRDVLSPLPLLAGDELVVIREDFSATTGAQGLTALRTSDGAEVWTRRLDTPGCLASVEQPAASPDAVFAWVSRSCDGPATGTLEAFDRATGAPRGSVALAGWPYVDEQGGVALLHWGGEHDELVALAPDRALRWRAPGSGADWRSAVGLGVVVADDGVHDAAAVALRFPLSGFTRSPVLADGAIVWIEAVSTREPVRMKRQALDAVAPSWDVVLAEPFPEGGYGKAWTSFTWPVATSVGTFLVLEHQWSLYDANHRASFLREIDRDGKDVFRLRLPPGTYGGDQSFALHDGRVAVVVERDGDTPAIRAFDVPGRAPAAHGWVTIGGTMARDRRAR